MRRTGVKIKISNTEMRVEESVRKNLRGYTVGGKGRKKNMQERNEER